ncbi:MULTISPECIES: hypothetical protein [Aeromonas]|jgi:hypothetical protein|uniref:Uncharacterized protein n=1 Tax=Aeromonas bestiarum TaxID=105751 RepID=A0ABT7Q279_9GAMM|nr:hypothetical protein [Aeromonas bestiarum]MDM5073011.1 hypothetical protein [Aeromonas bestiarum]
MNKTALLLSLLLVHGVAFAAPPSKNNDGVKLSTDDIKLDINWDQKEYDWWQNNCLDLGIGDSRIQLNCDKVDGKYRDHYNRSIHSGNNPGQGHNKQKGNSNGNGNGKKN